MRILSLAPLHGPALERIRSLGHLELDPWNAHVPVRLHAAADLEERLRGVEVFVVEADHVPARVIESAGALRVVGVCRGDPVNVDILAATKAGIAVLTAPGRNADAVADLALGLVIALTRGIVRADADVRAGRWLVEGRIPQQRFVGAEISTLTVGLVGCGAVGRATARRLAALGARVLGHDPYAEVAAMRAAGIEPAGLEEMLAASDVVSIHCVYDERTRGLLGAGAFGAIKPGAFLVNTARYGIVEEAPMLEALRSGRLAGAAFDHFENEVLPADHPLTRLPSVILTPHIGGTTTGAVVAHTEQIADGLAALLAGGEPPNIANPEVLPLRLGGPR